MKTRKTFLFLLFLCAGLSLFAQTNLVNNPGFETYSNANCGMAYYICNAPGWHMLNNTPDVLHPGCSCPESSSGSHVPRTGIGNARFASPSTGQDEYFYGSTSALTAGQTYVVSFWVRKDYTTTKNISMGMHIGSNVPSPMQLNPYVQTIVPQIRITPTTTEYIRASTCFTAQQNGIHYLTFGAFGGNGTQENQLFLIDDISLVELQDGQNGMTASLSIPQTTYCTTATSIIIDGSASNNEIEYKWQLYKLDNGNETFEYETPLTTGQAGTINAISLMNQVNLVPQYGECYRVYLTVYNGCDNSAHVDFCFDDPRFSFITSGAPVCENVPTQLQVNGSDGWTYTWSTGQSGTGIKNITVTPTYPSVSYTVIATTPPPASCSYSKTIDLTVHTANNVAPTMNGINGDANNYTYYVNAGDAVNFTSLISNNAGETVTTTFVGSLPSGFLVTPPPSTQNGGVTTFNWQTNYNSIGSYDIVLKVEDNNACGKMSNIYKFHIIVICDYCPICITYDDRTPSNNPLPPSTKAGQCIEAGVNAPVIIGAGNSKYFQAGQSIDMGAFFDTDGGTYEAVIDPTTCATGCESCCDNFSGFTIDLPIPNVFTPNGDGTNDVWYAHDDDNPWCAFNATGFELYVVNQYQNVVYHQIRYEGQGCCPFRAPDNWVPSSIFWDGRVNTGLSQGQLVTEGVYFYILYLHGCGQTQVYSGNITVVDPQGMMQQSGTPTGTANNQLLTEPQMSATATVDGLPAEHFYVFPNPTAGFVRIKSSQPILKVQVLDANGKVWIEKTTELDQPVDLSQLSSGSYRIRTTLADLKVKENTIVKE